MDIENIPSASSLNAWSMKAMKKKEWNEAIKRWSLFRELYPENLSAWTKTALAYRRLKEFSEAESILMEAIDKFGKKSAYIQLAELYIVEKKLSDSIKLLEEIKNKYPKSVYPYKRLIDVLILDSKFDEADKQCAESLRRFKKSKPLIELYAEISMRRQDWETALVRWQAVIEQFPESKKGYKKASFAALKLGDKELSTQLKYQRKLGENWLQGESDSSEQVDRNVIVPTQFELF